MKINNHLLLKLLQALPQAQRTIIREFESLHLVCV